MVKGSDFSTVLSRMTRSSARETFQEKKSYELRYAGNKNRMLQEYIVGDVIEYLILWRHNGLYHLGIMRFVLNLTQGCLTLRICDNKHIIRIMPILMNFWQKHLMN